jgi:hypothetical protein
VVATVKVKAAPAVSARLATLVKVGVEPTVNVKAWLAVPVEFLAVRVMGKTPVTVGVPASVAVPLVPAVKVIPPGSVPVWVRVGVGVPLVVTAKLNAVPLTAVAVEALVMASPLLTVSSKLCVPVPALLAALMVST